MENKDDIKNEIKISKTEEEEIKEEKDLGKQNNSYSKLANLSRIENDANDSNDIEIEIDNDIFMHYNHGADNELTQSQIDRLNKIREEVQLRSERYSELSNNQLIKQKPKNETVLNINNTPNNNSSDTTSQFSHNIINYDYEESNNDINPNAERVFNRIHPFLYINNEPLIVIGPDVLYYIIIFSVSSFFSIIFYSLKSSFVIMKFLFIIGYLFYAITYTLLMVLNPGIPTDKSHIDLDELKKNYNQCSSCNCIFYKENGYITFHCNDCNVCVENFDHHCTFASKCIGKNNIFIFKLWLFSIPCYIIIIFFYIIL